MAIKISDQEFNSLVAEVERELGLASATNLSKADGDDEKDPKDGPPAAPESPAPSAPPDASASAAPPASPSPDASAPPADPSASPSADPAASPDGSADQPMDPEQLKAEYAALAPEELKMHYLAAKAALMAASPGAAGDGSAAPGGPPAPASASAPSAAPVVPTQKKEEPTVAAPMVMGKSEDTAKIAELQKNVDIMSKALDLLIGTPQRKAVTSISGLNKSETPKSMTRPEVMAKLNEKSRDPKLSKSDRTLINQFCLGNLPDANSLAHLLQ
ncbi:hypothetical protein UFOVP75_87 [uncultured Caudovirales phage]|uniref:Uncharacterized protein n=1 Tax=uncultured Caudovirales phage TaxID=2100421 RepID=A0A6J5L1U8_9CAUD|nr:hypothetical protein UFOVP75_87 [uncultured Caudovirales phage]